MTTGSVPLHPFDALDDPGAKGLELADGRPIFLVRRGDAVHAYLNRCPHARQRLDSWPDRFLTMAEDHILCGAHAALFRIEDGFCLSGPCAGKSLTSVPVEVSEGWVRLRE
ncbi:MAG: Rieske (2Fe-2S) protein [Parvibaculaceae bacterium]|nr:Rieske (2Fe-2S) protein [Parvibaculaceae bacterium]